MEKQVAFVNIGRKKSAVISLGISLALVRLDRLPGSNAVNKIACWVGVRVFDPVLGRLVSVSCCGSEKSREMG